MLLPTFVNGSGIVAALAATIDNPHAEEVTVPNVLTSGEVAPVIFNHLNAAHSRSQVDISQGVPGYQAINVPLNQANKLADVPHSAVAAAIEESETATYMEFFTSPADGPYFQSHKGTNVTKALEFADKNNAIIPFIFTNPGKTGMCILASATNHEGFVGEAATFMFAPNKTGTNNMLYLRPKSTIQVGNFLPSGIANFNGRMEAHFGCDKTCGKCGGPKSPIFSLAEWALVKKSESSAGANEGFWSNLSNVDGLSSNINITVYQANNKICHSRECKTTAKEVKKLCPANLLWRDGGNVGCSSECKATGSDIHCCTGAYSPGIPGICPPSSGYLKKLCPDAYSYATDDAGQMNICKEPRAVHVEFTAIN